MRVYFGIESLRSFLSSKSLGRIYYDCERMVVEQLDKYLFFSLDDVSIDDNDVSEFLKLITDWQGDDDGLITKFHDDSNSFPDRPFKGNCNIFFDKEQLSSIFLINEEKLPHLIAQGNFVIGGVGSEIEILSRFYYSGYQYTDEKELTKFSSWEDLNCWVKPCSDIVIIDNFIFSAKEDSPDYRELFEKNIYGLLHTLVVSSNANLVIYTQGKTGEYYIDTEYWKKIINDLKKWLRSNIKKLNEINVTIILAQRGKHGVGIKKHDRNIITNYYRIFSGDSFNFFDKNGNLVTNGDTITSFSFAQKARHNVALSILASVQKHKDRIQKINPDHIIGDCISNLVKF